MRRYPSTQRDLFGQSRGPETSAHGTPPMRLSLEEYISNWKPRGWEILVTNHHLNYRREWGLWEAIRDIVQNALDEAEAYQWGYDTHGLWIKDGGRGVLIKNFLMGGQQQKPDYMRGKFGEGMKIAALALLREGHQVRVLTRGFEIWAVLHPQKVQISPPVHEDCICFLWRENGTSTGTIWSIRGYTGPDYHRNFVQNLPRSLILAKAPSIITQPVQRYNLLLRNEGEAQGPLYDAGKYMGRLYCRDIWLKDIESPFSYNLWGFEVAPDRHGPLHESDMYRDMGRLWMGVSNPAYLKMLLNMLMDPPNAVGGWISTEEFKHMSFDPFTRDPVTGKLYSEIMVDNKTSWQRAWAAVAGPHVVIATEARFTGMVQHLGYRSQGMSWNVRTGLSLVIKTDVDLMREMADRLEQAKRVPDSQLTERQLANLTLARRIAEDYDRVGEVNAGLIPPPSEGMDRTAGFYEFGTGLIKIHVDVLDSTSKTVAVVIHELGHHEAYRRTGFKPDRQDEAYDLTKGHTESIERVSELTFTRLMRGEYDDELRDPYISW